MAAKLLFAKGLIVTLLLRFLPLVLLLCLVVAAYSFSFHHYLSLDSLKAQADSFKASLDDQPVLASLVFVGAYITSVALSLPVATFLTLLGGFLFGFVQGTLMVVTGATVGACIIFMVAKTSLGTTLREKAGDLYSKVEANMLDNAAGYLLFMRLVPVFPFVLVNIVPALFNVPLRVFALTTFFGIMPGSAVYVYFGQQLGEITTVSDLARPDLLIAFALLGVFALVPTLYKQLKRNKRKVQI